MSQMHKIHSSNNLLIDAKSNFRMLMYIIAFLAAAALIGRYMFYYMKIDSHSMLGIIKLFDLDEEHNIPSFFSTFLFLCASGLLYLNFRADAEKNGFWLLLSILFIFLSIDEANQIHEKLNNLKYQLEIFRSYKLQYVWVFPYLILTLFLAIFLKTFIFRLPKRTRFLFVLSAIVFLTGAIGFEIIHDYFLTLNHRVETFSLELLTCIEELCELVGIAIFIYANLQYLGTKNCLISVLNIDD